MSSTSTSTNMVYFLYICFSLQHWINISTSIGHSVEWPEKRMHHAATHLSGSLFVIVGEEYQYPRPLNDMWLCDTTTKLWKKVLLLVTILPYTSVVGMFLHVPLSWSGQEVVNQSHSLIKWRYLEQRNQHTSTCVIFLKPLVSSTLKFVHVCIHALWIHT